MANVLAFLAGFLCAVALFTLGGRIKHAAGQVGALLLLPIPFAAGFVPWIIRSYPDGDRTWPVFCAGLLCALAVWVVRDYRGPHFKTDTVLAPPAEFQHQLPRSHELPIRHAAAPPAGTDPGDTLGRIGSLLQVERRRAETSHGAQEAHRHEAAQEQQ